MNKHFEALAVSCLLFAGFGFAGSGNALAQGQAGGTTPPPKVLLLLNEGLKPGRGGNMHAKTESAFVQAFSAANWQQHYFGMDALSGKARSLFLVGYPSFEEYQKDIDATRKNPTLSAALDSASVADGDLLDTFENSIYAFREDLSLRAPVKIEDMRYMDISVFQIRPGHRKDWETLSKLYVKAFEKMPDAHWATFEKMYGTGSGGRYIAVSPMKSLAEVDASMKDQEKFASVVSAEDMQKIRELTASTIESVESHLFAINPKISYPPDSWVKGAPDFWGQK
ncbi:MAG TPA: hypothetical protein VM554_13980 [Acidisarcina sp.]|nr:hypothetical protein [Acidisarcina sp.]